MARLLLDENIPRGIVPALLAAGHDVVTIADAAPGASDRAVLALARTQSRALLSFDADFGDLLFRHAEPAPPALLLFRLHPIVLDELRDLALAALSGDFIGQFVVVSREGLRSRPLPNNP